jgi:hypothetical protein
MLDGFREWESAKNREIQLAQNLRKKKKNHEKKKVVPKVTKVGENAFPMSVKHWKVQQLENVIINERAREGVR